MKYIGKRKRILKFRLAEHRGYITNQDETKAIGKHFNTPGHSLSDLSITILEKVKTRDDLYRKERDYYLMKNIILWRIKQTTLELKREGGRL